MTIPVILSFGGGVNSAAVLSRWLREGKHLDLVVFAEGSTLAQIAKRAKTESTLDGWSRPSFECMAGACLATPANVGGAE